jgi:hypothetical protein
MTWWVGCAASLAQVKMQLRAGGRCRPTIGMTGVKDPLRAKNRYLYARRVLSYDRDDGGQRPPVSEKPLSLREKGAVL